MLERPDLQDERIATCLRDAYGLSVARVTFLPLGTDANTAVYRVITAEDVPYFLKLRRGDFDEISVTLPKFLSDQGITSIIAPLPTRSGPLWSPLDTFKAILYPFVEGQNGYEVDLTDRQWIDFGVALRDIHSIALPLTLMKRIPREDYSPRWRDAVRMFLTRVERDVFPDPVARALAAFLTARRAEILDLVGRAGRLARTLQIRSPETVLCHSDLHAGNVLIAGSALYIVDWDNPILAPRERDLMYAGGGQFGARRTPQEEEDLFYQGYGPIEIDPLALAYYRHERIVADIAVFCEQLLLSDMGGEDRAQSLKYLISNFQPGNTIDIAYQADRTKTETWNCENWR